MEGPNQVSAQAYLQAMRQRMEQALAKVAQAVNDAPDGAWINASEVPVRDLMGEYRRRVFEKALQMKADAAEASFSPGGRGDGPAAEG